MKSLIPLSFFAIGATAQGIAVTHPAPGSSVTPGEDLTVQVIRYNTIAQIVDAGLAIGIVPCPSNNCPDALAEVGSVLYTGPFKPQTHGPGQQYQNFSVHVPTTMTKGPAAINVARFFLAGAGGSPTLGEAQSKITVV